MLPFVVPGEKAEPEVMDKDTNIAQYPQSQEKTGGIHNLCYIDVNMFMFTLTCECYM